MAKFDGNEIKKAIEYIGQSGSIGTLDISFDAMDRLLIKYTEPMGQDIIVITIYKQEAEKFPEVTKTTRL
jgi:hypothetical protein